MMRHSPENGTALRWLFAIQLISMGAMEMSGPFWPMHLRELGQLPPHTLAWASGAAYAGPMAMAMCFTPWWGRVGDSIGHKPMLLRALLALAVTQFWIAMADSVVVILVARLVQGALAGFIAAAQAYGAGLVAGERRSSLMARLQVATAVGSVLGPMAGGWLYDQHGFRSVNLVAAAICLACALAAMFVLPATTACSPKKHTPAARTQPSFRHGAIAGLLFGIALVQTGKMMPQSFFGLFAEEVLHLSKQMTGLCYGATALGLCVAAPFWGKRFDVQPRGRVLAQVEWICWLCAALIAVQATCRHVQVILLARLAWGICLAALLPVFYGLLSQQAAADDQGRVLGAGNSAAKAGALVGAGIGGLALAWVPVEHLFWPVVAVYAVAAAGMRWIRNTQATAAAAV
jgi:MFS family permease